MKLILILGDQLNLNTPSLQRASDDHVILMCEVRSEATYVKHHKKKIAFVFSAMRHFAESLRQDGHAVRYTKYTDPENAGSLYGEVARAIADLKATEVIVTEPGEYRLRADMQGWAERLGVPVQILEDTRFLASHQEFKDWAQGRKQLRMEYFYREMRRKYSVLMDHGGPMGGAWNYDAENRSPPKDGLQVPTPYQETPDPITSVVLELVAENFPSHFGDLEPFPYAVTRAGALAALGHFVTERLALFGTYQDAMIEGEPWMFHSHIALYLNVGLLDPLESIRAAEQAFYDGLAPLNAVEGFIRQILGWREYVRGIYWLKMPTYKEENYFSASLALPDFYWDGVTQMNCLRQCVLETKENAYAHHIQRLMVLGNFALLAGIDPQEVNEWYLLVYADAYEWVELPNVHGMVLFADGGVLGSKPYAASGAYIKKMSNYCESCSYKVSVKNGPKACPFNYLYWDFMMRNESKLRGNPRLGFVYKTLDRMSDEKRDAVSADSASFFKAMKNHEKV